MDSAPADSPGGEPDTAPSGQPPAEPEVTERGSARTVDATRRAAFVGRWRERLARSVARGQGGLTVLALMVGVGAGLGAVGFRDMILGFTYLFSGHRDYSAVGHAANPLVPGLGIWFVVLVPVIGG